MKLCAIVITYNPNIEEVKSNINSYIGHVDKLIIWDNTPKENNPVKISLPDYNKIIHMGNGANSGISYALNRAVEYARDNGYTHLLTMDQDSLWENFSEFKDFAANFNQRHIFAPKINNRQETQQEYEVLRAHMNSGTIYPLKIIDKIGLFNENFFIDLIDTEYAFRAHKKGISIIQYNGARLVHQLGYHIIIKGHDINNYSPMRLYGITRNSIRMALSLKNKEALRSCYGFLKRYAFIRSWQIMCYEEDKLPKLRSIIEGILHGFTGQNKFSKRNNFK